MLKVSAQANTVTTKVGTMSFKNEDGTINIEALDTVFEGIKKEAEKTNGGNLAASRRFRLVTTAMEKVFLDMRKGTKK